LRNKKDNESLKDLIIVAEIIKPHGLKGHLKFFFYNEDSNSLVDDEFIYLSDHLDVLKLRVENINLISSTPLIKFYDINTRQEAEKYRKYKISVPKTALKKDDNTLYLFDFIGCDVYFDKKLIGLVKDVVTFSGNDLLLVETNEKKEHYIPINKKLIEFFDIEGRKLIMSNIEGLLDIC
jgi:16S rRNA processing protein RimM